MLCNKQKHSTTIPSSPSRHFPFRQSLTATQHYTLSITNQQHHYTWPPAGTTTEPRRKTTLQRHTTSFHNHQLPNSTNTPHPKYILPTNNKNLFHSTQPNCVTRRTLIHNAKLTTCTGQFTSEQSQRQPAFSYPWPYIASHTDKCTKLKYTYSRAHSSTAHSRTQTVPVNTGFIIDCALNRDTQHLH